MSSPLAAIAATIKSARTATVAAIRLTLSHWRAAPKLIGSRASPSALAKYALRLLVNSRHPAITMHAAHRPNNEPAGLRPAVAAARAAPAATTSHGAKKPASELVSENVANGSLLR